MQQMQQINILETHNFYEPIFPKPRYIEKGSSTDAESDWFSCCPDHTLYKQYLQGFVKYSWDGQKSAAQTGSREEVSERKKEVLEKSDNARGGNPPLPPLLCYK